MPTKDESQMFSYHASSHEEKEIKGIKMYRNDRFPVGVWMPLPNAIDRLLDHIQLKTNTFNRGALLKRIKIDATCISKFRNGHTKDFPQEWLVKMSEYSTMTIPELRVVGGLKPIVRVFTDYN